jgi:hypothetical protein
VDDKLVTPEPSPSVRSNVPVASGRVIVLSVELVPATIVCVAVPDTLPCIVTLLNVNPQKTQLGHT